MAELGHVVFCVQQLEPAVRFSSGIVGLTVVGRIFHGPCRTAERRPYPRAADRGRCRTRSAGRAADRAVPHRLEDRRQPRRPGAFPRAAGGGRHRDRGRGRPHRDQRRYRRDPDGSEVEPVRRRPGFGLAPRSVMDGSRR
ncbi:MAG: hypothetical protein MZU91_08430 [Desulfosudis oleivorans]|nr:hypothetical protein [Desulfosudis oleivorans]